MMKKPNPHRIFKKDFDYKRIYHRFDFLMQNYKAGQILDIGNIGGIMGQGKSQSSYHQFKKLIPSTSTLYGLDICLPIDKENYPNQKVGNLEEGLPYDNNFFDTIYLGEVLEHLQNPGKALQEIHRTLKADGVFILDVPNPYSLLRLLRYFFKRHEDLGNPTHLIFWTPSSLKSILKLNGFEIILLNTKLSNKFKLMPKFLIKGLGSHLLVVAKKISD